MGSYMHKLRCPLCGAYTKRKHGLIVPHRVFEYPGAPKRLTTFEEPCPATGVTPELAAQFDPDARGWQLRETCRVTQEHASAARAALDQHIAAVRKAIESGEADAEAREARAHAGAPSRAR